jgi:predicted ribosomally synthesized peptide with SipW-like signal peptide
MKKRNIALLLALVLVFGVAVGGTIAYLMDKTEVIINTFTTGNVDIDLTETTGETYKMTPNALIDKDPTVTVKAGSEACWVFVKVEETNNPATYLNYSIASPWKAVTGETGVYYIEQAATTANVSYPVLYDSSVIVRNLTNEDMDAAEANPPKLTFTAYAIQKEGFATAEAAWPQAVANATKYAP